MWHKSKTRESERDKEVSYKKIPDENYVRVKMIFDN